jgi:hypothetical protein
MADPHVVATVPTDPALADLRGELERRGMVVVPHGRHLCVRLPLFASVRVLREGDALRGVPQVGPFTRGPAVAASLAPLAATGAGLLVAGVTAPLAAAACVAVGIALAGVSGLVVAEGCLTRVMLLWELRARALPVAGGAAALPSPGETAGRPRAGGEPR